MCALLKLVYLWQNIFQLLRHRRDGGTWMKRSSPLEFSNTCTRTLKAAYHDSENISNQSHMLTCTPPLIHTYWNTKIWSGKWHSQSAMMKIRNYKRLLKTYVIISFHWTGQNYVGRTGVDRQLRTEETTLKDCNAPGDRCGHWHGTSIVTNSCHVTGHKTRSSDAENWETELCFWGVCQFKDMETSANWLMYHPDTNTGTCEGRDALSVCDRLKVHYVTFSALAVMNKTAWVLRKNIVARVYVYIQVTQVMGSCSV